MSAPRAPRARGRRPGGWAAPALLLVYATLACACGTTRTVTEYVEVKVPVEKEEREPPAELTEPPDLTPPTWVAPDHPDASSALTPEGEDLFRALLKELLARDCAWLAWGTQTEKQEQDCPE